METIYITLAEFNKSNHNVIENYPNEQFKKCQNKQTGEIYRLHIIYPNDKISVKILSFDESQWFCSNKDENLSFTSLTCNWFPKELIAGVNNGRYNMNHELSIKTGYVQSFNTGTRMEVFLTSKVNNAIDILIAHGFEIE